MIVVRVELWSAITGRKTLLGQAVISNDGTGTLDRGNYDVRVGRKGQEDLGTVYAEPQRRGRVENFARNSKNIWYLLRQALQSAGY